MTVPVESKIVVPSFFSSKTTDRSHKVQVFWKSKKYKTLLKPLYFNKKFLFVDCKEHWHENLKEWTSQLVKYWFPEISKDFNMLQKL